MTRVVVVGLFLLAGAVGCRDLVVPGAVEDPGLVRTIQGRITGVAAFDPGIALLTFQNERYVSDPDSVRSWTALTDAQGHFTTSVPRGTDGLADVEVDWVDATELQDAWILGVPLAGRTMELAYDAAVFEGRVEWPEGMDVALRSEAVLDFFRVDGRWLRPAAEIEPDVLGGFRTVLPSAAYGLRLVAADADRATELAASWPAVVASTELALDLPYVRRPFAPEVPSGLPDDVGLHFYTRRGTVSPLEPGILAESTFELASPPDSVWVVADPEARGVLGNPIEVVAPVLGPLGPDVDPTVPLVLDLGDATLRVDVVRGGALQEQIEVALYGPEVGTSFDYLFDPAPVYFTVPHGLYRLIVRDVDTRETVTRFVDVQGTVQVVVDLDAPSGGD